MVGVGAYPAEFDVPGSQTVPGQILGQVGGQVGMVGRSPEPAVDDHRDGPGAWAGGKAENAVLAGMGAVAH